MSSYDEQKKKTGKLSYDEQKKNYSPPRSAEAYSLSALKKDMLIILSRNYIDLNFLRTIRN